MEQYIYVEEPLRLFMLNKGYRLILDCQIKGKKYYVFKNNESSKELVETFSLETKKRMFFSSKLYFV